MARGRGRPPHEPTPQTRSLVNKLVVAGVSTDKIIQCIGVGSKATLYKHYREELENSLSLVTAEVTGCLLDKIREGDVQSIKFFMNTRAGWSEKYGVNLESEDGSMTPPRTIQVVGVEPRG